VAGVGLHRKTLSSGLLVLLLAVLAGCSSHATSAPKLPPAVSDWLKDSNGMSATLADYGMTGSATSADWVYLPARPPGRRSALYLFDVHGPFVWCPISLKAQHRWRSDREPVSLLSAAIRNGKGPCGFGSTVTNQIFSVDARQIPVRMAGGLTSNGSTAPNLAHLGKVGHVTFQDRSNSSHRWVVTALVVLLVALGLAVFVWRRRRRSAGAEAPSAAAIAEP
jgi:hypothetical protein